MAKQQVLRIRLQAYDHKILDVAVQKIVEMYSDWPYKVRARLFVYPEGHFGASVDD